MVFRRHSPAKHSERSSPAAQDERAATSQQYERPGEAPQGERAGMASQAAVTSQSATRTRHGLPGGWVMEFILGLATLVLGLIVAARPSGSLTVVAVLIGVLMVISGTFQVVRSLQGTGDNRAWRAIGGVLFFLVGIFLIRHTSLTLSLIALFSGLAFIIAGIAALAETAGGISAWERGWSALFGVICLAAGIAVLVTPIGSLTRLAIVLGWAFAAVGILHMIGAVISWRALRKQSRPEQVSVPGQRATGVEGTYGSARAGAPPNPPVGRWP
jgi:uncharacterized membrane protein HdeD (DUF308 family)